MFNNEEFNFSTEELNFLREHTKLDIISKAKLLILKRNIEKYPIIYKRVDPNISLQVDYSEMELLEYNLRVNAWIKSCREDWILFLHTGKGCNLRAYAREKLNEEMDIISNKVKVRIK